jgi:hypothetical protein
MKSWILAAVGALCLLSMRAQAQCATSCATVTPKHPVILVHGRNDTASRWDTLVASWTTRGYTEGVNLFRDALAGRCGGALLRALPGQPDRG